MSKTIEELKAELAAKRAAVKAEIEGKVEVAKITAELSILDNPMLKDIKTKQAIAEENLQKLMGLKVMFEDLPPVKTKNGTREVKVLRSYGLGEEVDQLIGVLGAIRFATEDHKEEMLMYTGLSVDTVEKCLDAGGSNTYFNKTHKVIVEGIPASASDFKMYLTSICETLELSSVDTSKITQKYLDVRFDNAKVRAEEELENHIRFMEIENSEDKIEYDV